MKIVATLILIASIGLFSCKNSSQAMSTNDPIPDPNKKTTNSKFNEDVPEYDIIISFISKGAGIDRDLKGKIDTEITAFNTKNKLSVTPEKLGWGREGEVDYNFILENLSTSQLKEFKSAIKEIIGSSDMADISYNQKSVHKR